MGSRSGEPMVYAASGLKPLILLRAVIPGLEALRQPKSDLSGRMAQAELGRGTLEGKNERGHPRPAGKDGPP